MISATNKRPEHLPNRKKRCRNRRSRARKQRKTLINLFETLPTDALEIVTRHMSSRPRLLDWNLYISIEDLQMLFQLNGLLGDTCRSMFESLIVEDEDEDECELKTVLSCSSGPRELSLPASNNSETCIASEAVRASGNMISHIDVSGLTDAQKVYRVLSLYKRPLCGLLVTIPDNNVGNAIIPHVNGLRELSLFAAAESDKMANLTALWSAVGPTLEKLTISRDYDLSRQLLKIVKKECRKLTWIEIESDSCLHGAVADLYASYGSALEYCQFGNMRVEKYQLVVEKCPNVQVEVTLHRQWEDAVTLLGKHLRNARIYLDRKINSRKLGDALAKCENLAELYLHDGRSDDCGMFHHFFSHKVCPSIICATMSNSMKALECIYVEGCFQNVPEALKQIGEGTEALKRITFIGGLAPQGAFLPMVEANPELSQVEIRLDIRHGRFSTEKREQSYLDIVDSFSRCPELSELICGIDGNDLGFSDSDEEEDNYDTQGFASVREACQPLRLRRVYVNIEKLDFFA